MDKSLEEKWEHLQIILDKNPKPKTDIQFLISAFIDLLQTLKNTDSRAEYELFIYMEENLKLIRDHGSKAAFQSKRGPKETLTNEVLSSIIPSGVIWDNVDSEGRVLDDITNEIINNPRTGEFDRFRKRVKAHLLTNYPDQFSHLDDRQITNIVDTITSPWSFTMNS